MKKCVLFFCLISMFLFISCSDEFTANPERHLQKTDFIIENNVISLAFDEKSALSMGIPADEYKMAVDLVKNTNLNLATKATQSDEDEEEYDLIIEDVIILVKDQNNWTNSNLQDVYLNQNGYNEFLLQMTCSTNNGSSMAHYLSINAISGQLTLYGGRTYNYRISNYAGPLLFLYDCELSGSMVILLFALVPKSN